MKMGKTEMNEDEVKDLLNEVNESTFDELEQEYEENVELISQVCNKEEARSMIDYYCKSESDKEFE